MMLMHTLNQTRQQDGTHYTCAVCAFHVIVPPHGTPDIVIDGGAVDSRHAGFGLAWISTAVPPPSPAVVCAGGT